MDSNDFRTGAGGSSTGGGNNMGNIRNENVMGDGGNDAMNDTTNITMGNGDSEGATPIIPLPAFSGNAPVLPQMNFTTDTNGNVNVSPRIPLPAPGEGDAVFSGNNSSGFQGTIITVLPRPVTSCFYCNSSSFGTIRFFNAAIGYQPFVVSINNRTAVDTLSYAEVSDYGRVSTGYQTITVSAANGYIYVSKQVRVTIGATLTIAIVGTAGGLDFVEVNDAFCYTPLGGACIRVSNLSYNAGPLTLSTYSGNISFQNVKFMEVTNYVRVVPSRYDIYVSNVNEALLSTEIAVRSGSQYTIYMFNWNESPTAIRTLIIEDRK
ncbi:MAG: DUF4397 domain-containing protein [Lachnospiraceae bacterium]|nr:DUF4397 domain-containing protein [Lachnospiraceae bacterium]